MYTATKGAENLGLTITKRQIWRFPATYLTDTDFADDIALLSGNIEDAQTLLTLVVNAANKVGLNINEDKTEHMSYNIPGNTELTANGKPLKKVTDFKYLGSWVDNSAKDIKVRKVQAWTATLKLDNIWKSSLPHRLKINFFRATVKSILLYVAETWTMTKELNKELDGTYIRLLRHTLNINWRQHIMNEELYADLPCISETIKSADFNLLGTVGEATKQQQIWFYGNHNMDKRSLEDQNWTISKTGLCHSPVERHRAQPRGIGYNDE